MYMDFLANILPLRSKIYNINFLLLSFKKTLFQFLNQPPSMLIFIYRQFLFLILYGAKKATSKTLE